MSEAAAKPYLIRALHEWCTDAGLTPYVAVKVDERTRVPREHVRNGEIVLNVGATATHRLTIDNEWILFAARFGGVSQEVAIPIAAVTGIFARETGYGLAFQATPAAGPTTPEGPKAPDGGAPGAKGPEAPGKPRAKLSVVK